MINWALDAKEYAYSNTIAQQEQDQTQDEVIDEEGEYQDGEEEGEIVAEGSAASPTLESDSHKHHSKHKRKHKHHLPSFHRKGHDKQDEAPQVHFLYSIIYNRLFLILK